jgi:hypothetical protein
MPILKCEKIFLFLFAFFIFNQPHIWLTALLCGGFSLTAHSASQLAITSTSLLPAYLNAAYSSSLLVMGGIITGATGC